MSSFKKCIEFWYLALNMTIKQLSMSWRVRMTQSRCMAMLLWWRPHIKTITCATLGSEGWLYVYIFGSDGFANRHICKPITAIHIARISLSTHWELYSCDCHASCPWPVSIGVTNTMMLHNPKRLPSSARYDSGETLSEHTLPLSEALAAQTKYACVPSWSLALACSNPVSSRLGFHQMAHR